LVQIERIGKTARGEEKMEFDARDVRIFGEPDDNIGHEPRPGAYGVATRPDGGILVVREASGLYLPGGGIQSWETPREALDREFLEETGYRIRAAEFVDHAGQYTERYFKECHFYRVALDLKRGLVEEPELEAGWLARGDAIETLAAPAFRWAVERALSEE
jgi:8-oxo-dGTP diphosphatase